VRDAADIADQLALKPGGGAVREVDFDRVAETAEPRLDRRCDLVIGAARAAKISMISSETSAAISRHLPATASRRPMAVRVSALANSASCWRKWGASCSARRSSATAVLAAGAILNAGTETERQALLPGIAAGDTIATLA
jgi:hypothetical protein